MADPRPRILDLFCGGGGAAMGYHRAGFDVVGVDIKPQPNYPFRFIPADALLFVRDRIGWGWDGLGGIDAIHASPPCQAYTKAQRLQGREHPDLIVPTRGLLKASGLPYVIENVPGAPLIDPVVLEGQMFPELRTHRPRWFECSFPVDVPFLRGPRPGPQVKMGRQPKGDEWIQVVGHFASMAQARRAMGIDWMTRDELSQAIPPAYCELIGRSLLEHLEAVAA
jgi:DNA (cytosine-5)-methyltransferase 1